MVRLPDSGHGSSCESGANDEQTTEAEPLAGLQGDGAKRSSALPDVPTTSEAGIADAEYPIWFGLFLPAKTPGAIIAKLESETLKALQTSKVRERLAALGIDPMAMSPADFAAHVQRELVRNADLVKAAGLKAQ